MLKLDIGNLNAKVGCWILESGWWRFDIGILKFEMLDSCILNDECWILIFWILDMDILNLDFQNLNFEVGYWNSCIVKFDIRFFFNLIVIVGLVGFWMMIVGYWNFECWGRILKFVLWSWILVFECWILEFWNVGYWTF